MANVKKTSNTKTKYIMVRRWETERSERVYLFTPILFPEMVGHDDMAKLFGGKDAIASAGFVRITVDENGVKHHEPYGESESLGKKANPKDAMIMNVLLGA